MKIPFLLFLTAGLILSGCAGPKKTVPEGDALLPEIDIVTVKENSDAALKLAQEAKADVEMLTARLADANNQLLTLSETMKSVSASKIEEMENRVAVLTEETKNIYHELDSLRLVVKAPKRGKQPAISTLNTFKPGSASTNALLSDDDRKYREGQSYFNAGRFLNAITAFKEAIKISPEGPQADNCQFWIGECYFNLTQYAQAIANYKMVFSRARTDKADDAQMRIAQSYMKLGDNNQAVVEFKNLLKLYPESEYAGEARKYVNQLEK